MVAGGRYDVGGAVPIAVPDDGVPKLVAEVEQISFSAARALQVGQPVLYVTERAVFRLTSEGIELIELAPGLDLVTDVLDHMAFKPLISPQLLQMDPRIFRPDPLGLDLEHAAEQVRP
jgi:propionate CoA-transferase